MLGICNYFPYGGSTTLYYYLGLPACVSVSRYNRRAAPMASPRVAPQCRPTQAPPPLREDELARCRRELRWHADTGPVVVAYATKIQHPWLLGLSAARLGLPIVVSGLGRSNNGLNWWVGFARKLPWARRALQLLEALRPGAPAIFFDSTDTLIVNPLSGSAAQMLGEVVGSPRPTVLIGAECNSWCAEPSVLFGAAVPLTRAL